MKNVLVLGASGNIAPHVTPGLEPYYHLRLGDIKAHPLGKPVTTVNMASYQDVLEASRGMDAIVNFTVIRDHPVQSFEVSTKGAYHVMKAAVEHGIKKVIHTGPELKKEMDSGPELVRGGYDHEFDIDELPPMPGTSYYPFTKYLSMEICKIYSRTYDIQTICFWFNGLGSKPTEPVARQDFPPFRVVWEDLQHVCRLALEIESVPDNFQAFRILSYLSHGKYRIEKARSILGYEPLEKLEDYFKRVI